ncbi:MAG TPA: hypothetical protein VJ112_03085 [Rhabdochlamydiaceae bacterium]|nr:hypothetical protein [Rhabdochlamydiaceae bacterium]
MNDASWIFCKAFLQKCPPDQRGALISYLPAADQKNLDRAPLPSSDPSQGATPPEELLDKIHYSWFAPFLRTLPENDIRLYFAVLNDAQAKELKKALLFSNHLPSLTPLATLFLQRSLWGKMLEHGEEPLPPEGLPKSPLNQLLQFTYEELLSLIDLLAIHDLTVELRQIIDTAKLKKIYSLLSKRQLAYLKTLAQKKETLSFKKMSLNKWDGNPENLKTMLQQRGINRLAKSLFGESSSLLWHLTHRLDIDRANILQNLCNPLDHPQAIGILRGQVAELIQSIKNSTHL